MKLKFLSNLICQYTYGVTGQSITYITGSWGINALLDTNQTYNFYLRTSGCSVTVQSNTATATTFDIEAPTLSAVAGPGFDQITLSFTGIPGSSGTYWIRGAPHNSGNYVGTAEFHNVAAGQTVTRIINAFGVNNFLDTNKSYDFYLSTSSGSRVPESSVVSATTFDIGVPTLSATQIDDTHAKLT
jgi:hypothetical protein